MIDSNPSSVGPDDLDECWCCGGLHDSVGGLCPNCDDADCSHFGDDCSSDHVPVIPDGGSSVEADQFEPETDWDRLIEKLAKLKADLAQIQRESTEEHVHFDLQSAINFFASDFDTFARNLIEYQHGGEMPDICPVCGDSVVQLDELESGVSHDVDRMCIQEKSSDGIGHGIIHFSQPQSVREEDHAE